MIDNQDIRKDLIRAWKRYVNDSYTYDDVTLILDSIKDDDHLQEFTEVFNKVVWRRAMNDLPPTPEEKELYRRKAAQLLAEYQKRQKIEQRRIFSRNNIIRFRKIWYAAAAAAIFLGILIPAYLYMKPETEQVAAIQYVEESTQRGEIKTIVLPDDTKVTLNVGSRIIYPDNFTGDERPVELYGEALFNVTADPARPFTVKTENMSIKVTGTVFNVKEYADDLTASVSVASGKVEVGLADEKIKLLQNQQVKMVKATENFEKTTFDADKFLSWTEGTLYFYRTPIREVVNILNRQYPHVDINLVEGEYANEISGRHKKDVEIEDILRFIVYTTGLKCAKTGINEYTLYKN